MVDAPYGAEQADEGRGRAHRREERETALQAVADDVDRPLQRHADPGIEVELLGLHGAVVLGR